MPIALYTKNLMDDLARDGIAFHKTHKHLDASTARTRLNNAAGRLGMKVSTMGTTQGVVAVVTAEDRRGRLF